MHSQNFDFDIQFDDAAGENNVATGRCVVDFTINRPDPSVGIYHYDIEVNSVSDILITINEDVDFAPLAADHPLRERIVAAITETFEYCWELED